jgi:hypothetical protein
MSLTGSAKSLFRPASALSPGGDVFDAVDEDAQLPQKLVLRTVRAEYTNLAETSKQNSVNLCKSVSILSFYSVLSACPA